MRERGLTALHERSDQTERSVSPLVTSSPSYIVSSSNPISTSSQSETEMGRENVIMTFKLEKFEELSQEDVKAFIKMIEFTFMGMASQFATEENKLKAKAYLLWNNTTQDARKFINDMDSKDRDDSHSLMTLLRERFPRQRLKNRQAEAMDRLFKLRQGDRKLRGYFDEARTIKRGLHSSLKSEMCKRLVMGLDNPITAQVVRALLGSNPDKTLSETIMIIEEAIENSDDDPDEAATRRSQANERELAGKPGHTPSACPNPEAPYEERERIRESHMKRMTTARMEAEEKRTYAPNDMASRQQQAVMSNVESTNPTKNYSTDRETIDE